MKKYLLFLITLFSTNFLVAQVPSYVPTTGLLAWYNFNGNGANANNASLNTLTNYGGTFVPNRFGAINSAVYLDGAGSQWMQLSTPTFTLSPTAAYTFSVWVNKAVQPSSGVVMMSGGSTTNNFITNIQGGTGTQFGACKQQSSWTWVNGTDTIGAWMHLVGTYASGAMKLYRDGVLEATSTFTTTGALSVNQTFWVGRGPGGNYYSGIIDDMGVWNRALTQTEITALYNSQTTTGIENPAINTNAVYPNPANTTITIKIDGKVGSGFELMNVEGKLMKEGKVLSNDFKLDIADLPKGIYYLKVVGSGQQAVKLVKE